MEALANVSNRVRMRGMSKRPKGGSGKKPNRKPSYVLYVRIDPALGAALDRFVEATKPKPTATTTTEAALEEFLKSRGFWPPTDASAD